MLNVQSRTDIPCSNIFHIVLVVCMDLKGVICFMFLSAFAKSRKATISFVMSVRPSVRPFVDFQQLGCHWTDLHEI